MSKHTINPNHIIISNQGYMYINGIEIAELKELEIKIVPEFTEIKVLNSVSKGKLLAGINGVINFELNKIYSRFKPAVLECYKYLQPFQFTLYATVKSPKKPGKKYRDEETISIDVCWLEGDLSLFALKSDADLLTEKFEAGFQIESANFRDIIDDGEDWESLAFFTKNHYNHPPAINE